MTNSQAWKVRLLNVFDQVWEFGREFDRKHEGGRRELVFRKRGEHVVEVSWEAGTNDCHRQHAIGGHELSALEKLVERLMRESEDT